MTEYRNRYLRAFTLTQIKALQLEPYRLARGKHPYRAGEAVSHMIFMESGLGSTIQLLGCGRSIEIWTYGGPFGMIGTHTILADPKSLFDYLARTDITGWKASREAIHAAMAQDADFADRMQLLSSVTLLAISKVAACRGYHSREQRLHRLLLMLHEALETTKLVLSRQTLADMVPMSRNHLYRVAESSHAFRLAQRHIEIIDVDALAQLACACFSEVVRDRRQALIIC